MHMCLLPDRQTYNTFDEKLIGLIYLVQFPPFSQGRYFLDKSSPFWKKCLLYALKWGSSFLLEYITKTRLFKYIENFITKTEKFQIKILIFFIVVLKI